MGYAQYLCIDRKNAAHFHINEVKFRYKRLRLASNKNKTIEKQRRLWFSSIDKILCTKEKSCDPFLQWISDSLRGFRKGGIIFTSIEYYQSKQTITDVGLNHRTFRYILTGLHKRFLSVPLNLHQFYKGCFSSPMLQEFFQKCRRTFGYNQSLKSEIRHSLPIIDQ